MMPIFAKRQREFDYLQLHWLEKTTGRPKHHWDLYIIKELLDNAIDADECWSQEQGESIELTIDIHYRHSVSLSIDSLSISVSNSAPFPAKLIPIAFDLSEYVSDKAPYNRPSRGQQGNALKTLIGIPYALHYELYGDYFQINKPLVIKTEEWTHEISFEIDEIRQRVRLMHRPQQNSSLNGTRIKVTIDRFVQERPRTLEDLHSWARRFALFNPHVTFHWRVRMSLSEEPTIWDFTANPTWHSLFTDVTPVHWYEYTQLRELLLTLERERGPEMPLLQVLQMFAGFTPSEDPTGEHVSGLCDRLGLQTIGDLRLISDHTQTLRNGLWQAMLRKGRKISAEQLGGIGEPHLTKILNDFFLLEKPPLYRRVVHDDLLDPTHPFVLELVLTRLPDGSKRIIWTGLNYTPTYEDPFLSRLLNPPILNEEQVFGLDGFLDAYGQTENQPVLLAMHLICPNIAYQDFSKTIIESQPFSQSLTQTLHEILTAFNNDQTAQVEDLQPAVYKLMPEAIRTLSSDSQQRFATAQLLRTIRHLLAMQLRVEGRDELADTWLGDPDANTRLQSYIQAFALEHPEAMVNLIQLERGRLSLPIHPDGYSTLALSQVDRRILDEACVNKILLVADPEVEAFILSNNLLTRFDMALLHTDGDFGSSFRALLQYLDRLGLPLALLHHATSVDCLLRERLLTQLAEAHLAHIPLHDLGLTPAHGKDLHLSAEPSPGGGDRAALARYLSSEEITFLVDNRQQFSLFSLTVTDFISWLDERFKECNLLPKSVPGDDLLHKIALTTERRTLTRWVAEQFYTMVGIDFLADQVIQALLVNSSTDDLTSQLREAIDVQPHKAWRAVWDNLVVKLCQEALTEQSEQINGLIIDYIHKSATREAY